MMRKQSFWERELLISVGLFLGFALFFTLLFYLHDGARIFGAPRSASAAFFGFAAAAGLSVVFVLFGVLAGLPQTVKRSFRAPLQKKVDLLNGWNARSRRARTAFLARAEIVAQAPRLREVLYRDPEDGRYWLATHVERGHASGSEFYPVRASGLVAMGERFGVELREGAEP